MNINNYLQFQFFVVNVRKKINITICTKNRNIANVQLKIIYVTSFAQEMNMKLQLGFKNKC